MPNYTNNDIAKLWRDNQQVFFWQSEIVTAPQLSRAFQMERVNRSFYPWGASFEVMFASAPGAFEIDIMAANNDLVGNYISIGSITTVNSSNVGRFDMPSNIWPKYMAGYVKTLANAVAITLQGTR